MANKRSCKEQIKSLSWIYLILAIIGVVFAVLLITVPQLKEAAQGITRNDGIDPFVYAEATIIFNILIFLWYFWLMGRYADGKSNGTLLMILLILGIIGAIASIIINKNLSFISITNIADILALYYLIKDKNE